MQISALLTLVGILRFATAASVEDTEGPQRYIVRFRSLSEEEREEHHGWMKREVLSEDSSDSKKVEGSFHFSDDMSGYYGEFTKREIDLIASSPHVSFVEKEQKVKRPPHHFPDEYQNLTEHAGNTSLPEQSQSGNSGNDPSARDTENIPDSSAGSDDMTDSSDLASNSTSFPDDSSFDGLSSDTSSWDAGSAAALEVQNNAGWPLAMISHKERTNKREYVYERTDYSNILAYVIDSGCDPSHEDYRANLRNNAAQGYGTDDGANHATPICAIIGGRKFGVAKGVQLVSVKMQSLSYNYYGVAAMIDAFQWVLNDYKRPENRGKKAVINFSVDAVRSPNFNDAFKALQNAGIAIVMSAGNLATNNCQLYTDIVGSDLTVIVGSVDANYNQARSSNYGPCLSVYGPGDSVVSASRGGPNAEGLFYGTSFASPHVAGLIAYYMSLDPSLDARGAVQKVINSNPGRVQNIGPGSRNFLAYNGAA